MYYEYKIKKIDNIYDGDTITVTLDLGFNTYRTEKLRLYGINTPEIRGKEKKQGLISKKEVELILQKAIINNYEIIIRTIKDKQGKYGRYLAEILIKESEDKIVNLNKLLVEKGLAKEYMI
jgi:micrococcal nuclease